MKRHIFQTAAVALAGLGLLTACGSGAQELAVPQDAAPLSYTEFEVEERETLRFAAETFAQTFLSRCAKDNPREGNLVLAPVSVYSALSLAAVCAEGETRTELLSALNVSFEELKEGFSVFYRGLNAEYRSNTNALSGKLTLGNSIWLQSGLPAKQSCLDLLSQQFFCYAYAADFAGDNSGANRAVRKFVKTQTNGLIDRDLQLDELTRFTLVNSLYLKDVWDTYGKELSLTPEPVAFTQGDGSVEPLRLMQSYYERGRAFEGENFTSFFAETDHGYRLHFMVPNAGFTAEEIFTEENLAALMTADYRPDDAENKVHYYTQCLFPAFEGEFNGDVKGVLREMGVEKLFRDPFYESDGCSFASLTEEKAFVGEVRHITKLKVDRRGIEGAAVTVLPAAGSPGPDGWEETYEQFVIDRAFAFVLTDRYGTTLFAGIVKTV